MAQQTRPLLAYDRMDGAQRAQIAYEHATGQPYDPLATLHDAVQDLRWLEWKKANPTMKDDTFRNVLRSGFL